MAQKQIYRSMEHDSKPRNKLLVNMSKFGRKVIFVVSLLDAHLCNFPVFNNISRKVSYKARKWRVVGS